MSDDKRPVPTGPGWWWVRAGDGDVAVLIERHVRRGLVCHYGDTGYTVPGGLHWIAPALTPAEADALRERAEGAEAALLAVSDVMGLVRAAVLASPEIVARHVADVVADASRLHAEKMEQFRARVVAEAERDRYREAVGRLRAVLAEAAFYVPNEAPLLEEVDEVRASTTDEAIQGYPEPPEPDAVLVAKANAALVEEVAELRADLAAERGEAEGAVSDLWRPEFDYEGVVKWIMATRYGDFVIVGPRKWYPQSYWLDDAPRGSAEALDAACEAEPASKSARAAMRSASAEARRLGLIGSEP